MTTNQALIGTNPGKDQKSWTEQTREQTQKRECRSMIQSHDGERLELPLYYLRIVVEPPQIGRRRIHSTQPEDICPLKHLTRGKDLTQHLQQATNPQQQKHEPTTKTKPEAEEEPPQAIRMEHQ